MFSHIFIISYIFDESYIYYSDIDIITVFASATWTLSHQQKVEDRNTWGRFRIVSTVVLLSKIILFILIIYLS